MTTLEIVFWCIALYLMLGCAVHLHQINARLKDRLPTKDEKMRRQWEEDDRRERSRPYSKAADEARDKLQREIDAKMAELDERDRKASGQ